MPLYDNAKALIWKNLVALAAGDRPKMIAIGYLADTQLYDLNVVRRGLKLNEVTNREIVFIGRHIFNSRNADGYTVDDMVSQIESALAESSQIIANSKMTSMQNQSARDDNYGNKIKDLAVFECSQRKPRAELFSVVPKGDLISPKLGRAPPLPKEPLVDDPG